jgi:hypothetical protein
VDDVSWGALTLTLTIVGGFYTWWAFRNRGATAAVRGLALTLLPAAAWLTGTLEMFSRIANAISDWALHLVFSPRVWLGVILAGLSVTLFFVAGFMRKRGIGGGSSASGEPRSTEPASAPKALPRAQQPSGPLDDDGLDDEIAAILKRRGIS